MHKRPTAREFLASTFKTWGDHVSGTFQVVFTLLFTVVIGGASLITVISQDLVTRISTTLLGLLALAIAIYKVWKVERDRVCDLESLYEPKLELLFDPKKSGCMAITDLSYSYKHAVVGGEKALYVRILPKCLKGKVNRCKAILSRILLWKDSSWIETPFDEGLEMHWSNFNEKTDGRLADLHDGFDQYLDVFFTTENRNKIHPVLYGIPNRAKDVFEAPGPFRFDVFVVGENNVEARISLKAEIGRTWDKPIVASIPG